MNTEKNIKLGIRVRKIILFILFIAVITLPLLEYGLNISKEYENTENRNKAPLPKFNINLLDPFPAQFDSYFSDNHNFRGDLLLLNSMFKFNILNMSLVKHVVEGEDGWLYTTKYIESYINKRLLTNIELDSLHSIYTQRSKWLSDRGIKQYIAIVPVKAQVYPEFLPEQFKNRSAVTKTEQFIETLEDIPNLNIIYLKDAIVSEKEKSDYNLFYKTDQHWNEYGALIGLRELIHKIKKDFPEVSEIEVDNYVFDTVSTDGLGLAKVLMLQNSIKEMEIKISQKEKVQHKKIDTLKYEIPEVFPYKNAHQLYYSSSNKKLPKALIIRDSFTHALTKQLPESFSESTFIWDTWCYELHEDIIENEKPDIFITIIIETNIPFIIYKHNTMREDGYNAIDPK